MALLSILVVILLATVHLPTGSSPTQAINLELQDGNALARLLMVTLCLTVLAFAARLRQNGHLIRTALLLLDVPGLLVVACTRQDTVIHEATLEAVSLMTVLWFVVMAADYECPAIYAASAICIIVLPLLFFLAAGLAETALILYCLYCMNLLYHWYLKAGSQQEP